MKKDLIGSGKKVSVIITERISKKLRKLEIVKVAKGYFRNYLKPNGYAVIYTEDNLEKIKASVVKVSTHEHDQYKNQLKSLNGQILYFAREASAKGILFGSVTNRDISKEIQDRYNIIVDYKKIELSGSEKKISKLGIYDAHLDLFDDLLINIKIHVGLTLEDAKKLTSEEIKINRTEVKEEKIVESSKVHIKTKEESKQEKQVEVSDSQTEKFENIDSEMGDEIDPK